jgi:SAM-dependent methyltransferase
VRRSYEGGAKTWECTYDLLQLLGGESGRPYVVRKRVLDLGCGTGLLGAAALLLGAAAVAFADLNAPVLCHVTAANIALNPPPDGPPAGAAAPTLIAGDWAALRDAVQRGAGPLTRYEVDTVLSSETLYDPAAYGVLLDLLSLLLEPSAGVALFATKRFYFGDGLGGGTTAFLDACAARRTPALSAQCVATVEDGQSMIRDIVAVRITAT